MNLISPEEKEYYLRHFSLPGFNEETQFKLKNARVLVVGSGGLGSPCLLYLAGAGVGHIGIVDKDIVSVSNLPRQVIFDYTAIGKEKVDCARQRLLALNPFINVEVYPTFLNTTNAEILINNYDIIVDCTDNFDAKYLINDICEQQRKPLVYASIFQYEGQLSVFHYHKDPSGGKSYRDLFPEAPQPELRENCSDAGVLGVLPGILGTLQANEVLKIITGNGDVLSSNVMIYDALTSKTNLLRLNKRLVSTTEVNSELNDNDNISSSELIEMKMENSNFFLLDVRENTERDMFSIGGKHIPLRELPMRLDELPKERRIVCYCKAGSRSKRAIIFLQDQGFDDAVSLTGGVMGLTHTEQSLLLKNIDEYYDEP